MKNGSFGEVVEKVHRVYGFIHRAPYAVEGPPFTGDHARPHNDVPGHPSAARR